MAATRACEVWTVCFTMYELHVTQICIEITQRDQYKIADNFCKGI